MVADQSWKKSDGSDSGGSTRQGLYMLTAGGKLLFMQNNTRADYVRYLLQRGLDAWKKLPESERRAGAVQVEDFKPDPQYHREPPAGGLILRVFTRALDRDGRGTLCDAKCKTGAGDEVARDYLWLTESEWKSLIPGDPKAGDKMLIPARIADRIIQFNLVDNTTGEARFWLPEEIRSKELTLVVEQASQSEVRLRLEGTVLVATDADIAKAERSFDVRLLGWINYNAGKKIIDRFDVLALGDSKGGGGFNARQSRSGRAPLGIAFELAPANSEADKVTPEGARYLPGYFIAAQ